MLKKGDIEIPADLAGVLYTKFDERGGWKRKPLSELAYVHVPFDKEKAISALFSVFNMKKAAKRPSHLVSRHYPEHFYIFPALQTTPSQFWMNRKQHSICFLMENACFGGFLKTKVTARASLNWSSPKRAGHTILS